MRVGVVLVVLWLGCGPGDPPQVDHHLPTPAERAAAPPSSAERMFPQPAPEAPRPATQVAEWSDVVTTDGCFYFSGPDGHDDRLTGDVQVERHGDAVSLTIGTTAFTGTYKAGELHAERRSIYQFHGAWTTTETIDGHHVEGQIRARYHYAECAHGKPCPGPCTIDATLIFVRRRT